MKEDPTKDSEKFKLEHVKAEVLDKLASISALSNSMRVNIVFRILESEDQTINIKRKGLEQRLPELAKELKNLRAQCTNLTKMGWLEKVGIGQFKLKPEMIEELTFLFAKILFIAKPKGDGQEQIPETTL